MGGKDGCKGRLEAATISDILYLFGRGNLIFIREKSGNFENSCLWQPRPVTLVVFFPVLTSY